MDKKIIAIAVVAILVAAGVGGVLLYQNGNGSNEKQNSVQVSFAYNDDIRLAIFGNANGDDYLNTEDVKLLKQLISGATPYDTKQNCFADTNADGVLNSDDVALLEKIIAGEKCTLHYWSCTKTVQSIQFPLSGNIGTHHMYMIDALTILGLYSKVVGTSHQTFQNSIATDGLRYPGMGTTIADVGSPWENCEAAVKAGINVWLDSSSSSSHDYSNYKTVADAAGLNLQIVRLYITNYSTSCAEIYGSILMMGVMFQCESAAHDYVKWVDGVRSYITESSSKLTEKWTFLTPMGTKSSTDISLDTVFTDGSMMGDVYSISLTGMTSVNTVVESGCPSISLETIYKLDPDVIVIIMFQTSDKSVSDIQKDFDAYAAIYSQTNAYKNGNVYGVNYYNIASCAGASELVLLSSYIWPTIFSEQSGWSYLQYYYDHFTNYKNVDVSAMGNAIPYRLSA